MVKTNTFNGINLPSIALYNSETGMYRVVKAFGYADFKSRKKKKKKHLYPFKNFLYSIA